MPYGHQAALRDWCTSCVMDSVVPDSVHALLEVRKHTHAMRNAVHNMTRMFMRTFD